MKRIFVGLMACFCLISAVGFGFNYICDYCGVRSPNEAFFCQACQAPLNRCFFCQADNSAGQSNCGRCFRNLAEGRILQSIDPRIRGEYRLGESNRALRELELGRLRELQKVDPRNEEDYLWNRAQLLREMNFVSRETEVLKELLWKYPNTYRRNLIVPELSEAIRKWGCLFFLQGMRVDAREKFVEATVVDPSNAEAWLWLARIDLEDNRKSEAAAEYKRALDARPGDKTAVHFLRKLGKPDARRAKRRKR